MVVLKSPEAIVGSYEDIQVIYIIDLPQTAQATQVIVRLQIEEKVLSFNITLLLPPESWT